MTGYKIPEGWAIGWRNAFKRYPKDSEYAWGMNAVIESIEAFPLEELEENPWHTGTPQEEGRYLVHLRGKHNGIEYEEACDFEWLKDYFDFPDRDDYRVFEVVAWQKITQYKEF